MGITAGTPANNRVELFKPGALLEYWASIPSLIQDAIEFVRDLFPRICNPEISRVANCTRAKIQMFSKKRLPSSTMDRSALNYSG